MIIKITPDYEKAKSLIKIANMRFEFLETLDKNKFATIALETYYEILKELTSSILLIKGYKTIGEYAHKELFQKALELKIINTQEHNILDDLRIRRNTSSYDGVEVDKSFLNNEKQIISLIIKLKIYR
jgi:hypothetical protein